jgi:hypothetical protein
VRSSSDPPAAAFDRKKSATASISLERSRGWPHSLRIRVSSRDRQRHDHHAENTAETASSTGTTTNMGAITVLSLVMMHGERNAS